MNIILKKAVCVGMLLIMVFSMPFAGRESVYAAEAPYLTMYTELIQLPMNGTQQISYDTNADKVTWTSDKTTVATVDATGKVHAEAAGEATITAKAGDKTATCTVTVTAKASSDSGTLNPMGEPENL